MCASRFRGVECCLTEAVGHDKDTDPGFDGGILPGYMADGSPCQIGTAHPCVYEVRDILVPLYYGVCEASDN